MGESQSHRPSVHLALGGGAVGDVLLWKRWPGSLYLLVGSSGLWFLFERAGYNLLSFVSTVLLLLVFILFSWAKCASLLNRPLPPLPTLEVSEENAIKAADEICVWLNHALSIAHDITINGNLILFFQVAISLWIISYIGSFFNFLTLVYAGVLLSLSVPVLYDKYQVPIDDKLNVVQIQYRRFDAKILSKIPFPSNKLKKNQ